MDFSFLKSNRFWALVGIAITFIAGQYGLITPDIASAIEVILGGHIIIRTTDRFSETIGV